MTAFAAQVASAGAMQVLRAIPAAIGWAVIVLTGLAVLAAGLAWLACRANPLARVLDEHEQTRELAEVISSIRDAQPEPEPDGWRDVAARYARGEIDLG